MIDFERLKDLLMEYFGIGDSYVYVLTRVKEAISYGALSLKDFDEFSEEEEVDHIVDFLKSRFDHDNAAEQKSTKSNQEKLDKILEYVIAKEDYFDQQVAEVRGQKDSVSEIKYMLKASTYRDVRCFIEDVMEEE